MVINTLPSFTWSLVPLTILQTLPNILESYDLIGEGGQQRKIDS